MLAKLVCRLVGHAWVSRDWFRLPNSDATRYRTKVCPRCGAYRTKVLHEGPSGPGRYPPARIPDQGK